jgi:hypothetical protein
VRRVGGSQQQESEEQRLVAIRMRRRLEMPEVFERSEGRTVMPYIKRKDLDRLTLAGDLMSNVCHNWKQSKEIVTKEERAKLGELQEEWDRARATAIRSRR